MELNGSLPLSFKLKVLPDLGRLMCKDVLELLLLLSEHLHLTLVVLNVIVHSTNHVLSNDQSERV